MRHAPAAIIATGNAHVFRRALQCVFDLAPIGRVAGVGDALGEQITRQINHLCRRYLLAKKHAGDFGYLVRLVKHHGVDRGQQLGNAFFAQHHIGKK